MPKKIRELIRALKKAGFECKVIKAEGGKEFSTDAEYFTNGTKIKVKDVRTQTRGCRRCKSELSRCVGDTATGKPLVILVEFILI